MVQLDLVSVFNYHVNRGHIDKMRARVYAYFLRVGKPVTTNEFIDTFQLLSTKKWQPRITELCKAGKLRKLPMRKCKITGRMAHPIEAI